jgi:hypothetical protein
MTAKSLKGCFIVNMLLDALSRLFGFVGIAF